MQFKDILVFLDDGHSNHERIEAAVELARPNGGRLVGVAFELDVPRRVAAIIPSAVLDIQHKAAATAATALIDDFTATLNGADLDHATHIIRGDESTAIRQLGLLARRYDVAVLRQANPDSPQVGMISDCAESVLFNSGRPVFFMPYVGAHKIPCETAVIAWDGSRAASRAVHDSLPLLERMTDVVVLTVNPSDKFMVDTKKPGAAISEHLARHGINSRVLNIPAKEVDASIIILNTLADTGADMLIMGGYGTSRLAEMMLGGVTKEILHDMTVPVFMSH